MNKAQLVQLLKARVSLPSGDYAAALKQKKWNEEAVKAASFILSGFPRNASGLTPDGIKATSEYKEAKTLFDELFKRLQMYNALFLKEYKAEYRADRSNRRSTVGAVSTKRTKITMTPELQAKVKTASVLGEKAFADGKKCIPAQDAKLMQLLKGLPLGGGAPIMKAWSDAWHKQNLKSPTEATAAPIKIADIEHTIRAIFKKAGLPLGRKDRVVAMRRK